MYLNGGVKQVGAFVLHGGAAQGLSPLVCGEPTHP